MPSARTTPPREESQGMADAVGGGGGDEIAKQPQMLLQGGSAGKRGFPRARRVSRKASKRGAGCACVKVKRNDRRVRRRVRCVRMCARGVVIALGYFLPVSPISVFGNVHSPFFCVRVFLKIFLEPRIRDPRPTWLHRVQNASYRRLGSNFFALGSPVEIALQAFLPPKLPGRLQVVCTRGDGSRPTDTTEREQRCRGTLTRVLDTLALPLNRSTVSSSVA